MSNKKTHENKENKNTKIDNLDEIPNEEEKIGFIKEVWYSITKIEKYPELAARGFGKAVNYVVKIVACIALIIGLGSLYKTHNVTRKGVNYLENQFPDFSYNDGTLNVESTEPITISENSYVGKIIIDTKTDDEATINQYLDQIDIGEDGIIVLKNKAILKRASIAGTLSYNYKDILEPFNITKFNKSDVINYANSGKIIKLYISIFITIFIYAFALYFLTTFSNAVLLSILGIITSYLARIKMRYVGIFNMSIYALTLSTLLNAIYIGINIFVSFSMQYFQIMYVSVATIYLVAAILILKTDIIKKQMELMKIEKTEDLLEKQLEEKKREHEEKKQEEEKNPKDESDKKDENENNEKKEKDNKETKDKEKKDNLGDEPA